MKKTFYYAAMLIALLAFAPMQAQEFHIGAKAGANLGKVDGVRYDNQFKLGYQLGGVVEFDFNDKWGLQGEVLFNQTNTDLNNSVDEIWNKKFDKGKTLNYISVPVLLKFNPGGVLSLHAGPQFSFLANSDQKWTANAKKLFKDTDFSLVAGAEVNILKPLYIYGRYVWGYSDIDNAFDEKATTQQIQLGVGLRF